MEHHWFTPEPMTSPPENQETKTKKYISFIPEIDQDSYEKGIVLDTEFAKLQDTVCKDKNIRQILELLDKKIEESGDGAALTVGRALMFNDIHELYVSGSPAEKLIPGVHAVSYMIEQIRADITTSMEHDCFTPELVTSENQESETKETFSSHDPFEKGNILSTEFAKLQEAVYKNKDNVKKTIHILCGKTTYCGDEAAPLVVRALRRNDIGVLYESLFFLDDLIRGVRIVTRMVEQMHSELIGTSSENQETSHDHLRSIAMGRLEMEFIKLQEAMNKSKDVAQSMRLLKKKALPSKRINCVTYKTRAIILQALRQNNFHVLSESNFNAIGLREEIHDVSNMLEEINNHDQIAMICQ